MATSREEIVSAGLALLDEVGLDGLTLRRLAARLGVKAPTLYWHVRNKRELLDLIADRITDEAYGPNRSIPAGTPWWEWLHDRGVALRAALVVTGNRPSPAAVPAIEAQLASLVDVGFTPRDALLAVLSVLSFVIGHVIDVQRELEREPGCRSAGAPPLCEPSALDDAAEGPVDTGRYPSLAAAIDGLRGADAEDARFEFGLRAIVAGIRNCPRQAVVADRRARPDDTRSQPVAERGREVVDGLIGCRAVFLGDGDRDEQQPGQRGGDHREQLAVAAHHEQSP